MNAPVPMPELPVEDPETITPVEAARLVDPASFTGIADQGLTLIVFAFGLITLAVFYFILHSGKSTEFLVRMYVIIILVFGTLLVVSSNYSSEQITPVVGFFGTIAGYLLGRGDRTTAPEPKRPDGDER